MKKLLVLSIILFGLSTFVSAGQLTKQTVVDRIEVLANGTVQVREAIKTLEDGVPIAQQFNRYVVSPGDDYSKRDAKVKAICEKIQTQAVIDAYKNPAEPIVTPGLKKETKADKIYVLEDGTVIARTTTRILDSGKEIGKSRTQETIVPGDAYAAKEKLVKDVCDVVQTQDVVTEYQAKHSKPVEVEK